MVDEQPSLVRQRVVQRIQQLAGDIQNLGAALVAALQDDDVGELLPKIDVGELYALRLQGAEAGLAGMAKRRLEGGAAGDHEAGVAVLRQQLRIGEAREGDLGTG